jgi:hypothetical protein
VLIYQESAAATDLGLSIRNVGDFIVTDFFKGFEGTFFHCALTLAADGTVKAYANSVVSAVPFSACPPIFTFFLLLSLRTVAN